MGERSDDADTDYLGEPEYTYTEEDTPSPGPEGEPVEEPVAAEDTPLTKKEQDARARRAGIIGAIAGLLVGAVAMLVVVALTGGDPAPEETADPEQIEELEAAVEERDSRIEALEAQLAELQAAVEERDAELEQLRQQVGEGETELAEQQAALEERSAALERRAAALDEREQALDDREEALAEREARPPPPDPGNGDPPVVDEDEAEELIDRIVDRIRELFE